MSAPTVNNDAATATLDAAAVIDRCSNCATPLALRRPTPEAPASTWLCQKCGSVYFAYKGTEDDAAAGVDAHPVSYREVMLAIDAHLQGGASPLATKDVQRLVRCLAARTYVGPNVRSQTRFPLAAPVTVVPLSADFRVAGQPARLMTTNVSSGGVALAHSQRITEPYLAVDFAPSGADILPAVMQVTRIRPLTLAFEIAGKFISRILH